MRKIHREAMDKVTEENIEEVKEELLQDEMAYKGHVTEIEKKRAVHLLKAMARRNKTLNRSKT